MCIKKTMLLAFFIFTVINVKGQVYSLNQIKDAFTKRLEDTPKEITFTHTDRDYYLLGEELLFKVYLVSFPILDTLSISKVCYVYLTDIKGKILQTQVLKVKDRAVSGVFSIPQKISNGTYYVTATTQWMQNFSNTTSHYKSIKIVNYYPDEKIVAIKKEKNIEVSFFPETGNLVHAINQKIGVRSINENGASVDVKIQIKNTKNEILQTFNTGVFGLSTFSFTPDSNEVYKAECLYKQNNITKIINLPVTNNKPSLSVNNQKKLFVQLNLPYQFDNQNYFLLGTYNGTLIFSEPFKITEVEKLITINKTDLPTGIITLSLVNEKAQLIAERFVWVNNQSGYLEPKLTVIKTTDNKKRERGELSIDFLKNINANVSINISKNPVCDSGQLNIFQYTQLLATLGNKIDYDIAALTQILKNKTSFDDMLLVNGWRKISAINLLEEEKLKYSNENGLYVAGKINKAQTKIAVPNAKLDLIILNADSSKYILSESANSNGEFIIKDVALTKNATIFYSAVNKAKANALVDVNFFKHFTDTLKSFSIARYENIFEKPNINYLEFLNKNDEFNKIKNLDAIKVVTKRTSETEKFDLIYTTPLFENADQSIVINKEPNTLNIWQVLQRNIAGITIANTDTGRIVYFNRYFGVDAFSENGLGTVQFFLNEQPVSQFEIESLMPEDVGYIKVYKGGLGYVLGAPRGGIAIYTVKNKKTGDWRDKGFANLDMQGYEPEYKLYNMQYSNNNILDKNIDVRPTLFWLPNKSIRNANSFKITYFTDDSNSYQNIIRIVGFTDANEAIFTEQIID